MAYSKDPHWALVCEPGLLLPHAGGDELYAIEDVSEAVAGEVLALWRAEVMRPGDLSAGAADVFTQLAAAGIVHNLIEPRLEYTLGVRFAGTRDAALEAAIAHALPAGIAVGGEKPDDLVLIVRTDGALADIVGADYASLTTPHLAPRPRLRSHGLSRTARLRGADGMSLLSRRPSHLLLGRPGGACQAR